MQKAEGHAVRNVAVPCLVILTFSFTIYAIPMSELGSRCLKTADFENVPENKMKPTNPNADTYVEKRRFNTYLSQFPANPLLEHLDDLTH